MINDEEFIRDCLSAFMNEFVETHQALTIIKSFKPAQKVKPFLTFESYEGKKTAPILLPIESSTILEKGLTKALLKTEEIITKYINKLKDLKCKEQ